jgi:hypothetical protein
MKPMPLERDVAAIVTDYLSLKGWLVIRTEANAVRSGTQNKRGIVPVGEPDARAYRNDKALHLEFKRPGAKPSNQQTLRHRYLEQFGIKVHVVRSLEDIAAIINGEDHE